MIQKQRGDSSHQIEFLVIFAHTQTHTCLGNVSASITGTGWCPDLPGHGCTPQLRQPLTRRQPAGACPLPLSLKSRLWQQW